MKDFTTPQFDRIYGNKDLEMLNMCLDGDFEFYRKDGHIWCRTKKREKNKRRQRP